MSAQAVGGAVGHNEISVIIPCHRVVGTNGSLTGYAGGIDKKIALLELEHIDINAGTGKKTCRRKSDEEQIKEVAVNTSAVCICEEYPPNASLTMIGLAVPVYTTVGVVMSAVYYICMNKKNNVGIADK